MDITKLPNKIECAPDVRNNVNALKKTLKYADLELVVIALYENILECGVETIEMSSDPDEIEMVNNVHSEILSGLATFDMTLEDLALGGLVARAHGEAEHSELETREVARLEVDRDFHVSSED